MSSLHDLESTLSTELRLSRRPVGVAFLDAPPDGVAAFSGRRPSGCSFWSLAAEGRAFYTVPGDHHNCPIGSYTHNMPLPANRAGELEEVLGLMSTLGYIRMEEVPAIPRMTASPQAVLYAPLGEMPVEPDVVILTGSPGGLMLLHEAAAARGVETRPLLGRPTCMALPAALGGSLFTSVGCIGNRVYTDLADGELYAVIGRADLATLAGALGAIAGANRQLAEYHAARRSELTA
jgi:uncharacterized protein (DUF169 family)